MATFHCRTAFISDVHLGTPDCKAAYLLDFLRRLRCEKLYLVGDIIDLEALGRRSGWQAEHGAVVAELLAMARRGVEVIYIPGNHDAPLRGLHGQQIGGVRIVPDAVHEGADGRRYRVSHGDEFDPEQIGRRWMLWLGETMHRFICWGNRRMHGVRQRLELPYLPLSIIVKSHVGRALAYIRAFEQRVADDARARLRWPHMRPYPLRPGASDRRRAVPQRRRLGGALHRAGGGSHRRDGTDPLERAARLARPRQPRAGTALARRSTGAGAAGPPPPRPQRTASGGVTLSCASAGRRHTRTRAAASAGWSAPSAR